MSSKRQKSKASAPVQYDVEVLNELRNRTDKRDQLQQALESLEKQIYALEAAYLEDTPFGNVLIGFENYAAASKQRVGQAPRQYTEKDRCFSLSSVTAYKSTPLIDDGSPIELLPVVPEDKKRRPGQQQQQQQEHEEGGAANEAQDQQHQPRSHRKREEPDHK